MKKVLFFAFCLSLFAEEFPFPADSKHVSMATDSLGDRIAIWEEKERILVSEKPVNGNWSMPSVLSSALEEATTPQLEIDSKGKASVKWVEGKKRKVASKSLKGEWVFKEPGEINVEKKKRISPIKRTIQPFANAIDAPTSSVLSGGQIGFAPGTAAPTDGLAVSGQVGIGTTTTPASLTKVSVTSASTDKYSIFCSGTLNGDDVIQTVGLYLNYTLSPTSNNKSVMGLLNTTFATPVGTNTITDASASVFFLGGTLGSGTVTQAYSTKCLTPTIGTSRTALYADDTAIGFLGITPPTNGLIVSGISGFGVSTIVNDTALPAQISAAAATERYFGANKGATYGLLVGYSNGSFVVTGGVIRNVAADPLYIYVNSTTQAAQFSVLGELGLNVTPTARLHVLSPSTSTSNQYVFYNTGEIISTTTSFTAAEAVDAFLSPSNTASVGASLLLFPKFAPAGAVTLGAGLYIDAMSGSGTVTNSYAIYARKPTLGTNRYCAYLEGPVGIGTAAPVNQLDVTTGAAIGTYAGVNTAPSNGMIVSGRVGVGTNAPVNQFDVSGAVAIGTYAGVDTAPSNGLIVSGQAFFGTQVTTFGGTAVEIVGSDRHTLFIGGTKAASASFQSALYIAPTYTPTTNTASAFNIYSIPTFNPPMGVTITTGANLYLFDGIPTGAGTVTTFYNLFVGAPRTGTTSYAASIQGGMVHKWNGQNIDYTIITNDYYVALTGTGTPRTFSLPATLPDAGWTVVVKDEGGGAATNNLTVSGNGNNIDGAANYVINTNYGAVRIYSNGTQYYTW